MVPKRTEPFARLFFLQGCESHRIFAASILETTSEMTLQTDCGGNKLNLRRNMNNTALQTIAAKALPALSGESLTYNAAKYVFLMPGNTSVAGNINLTSLVNWWMTSIATCRMRNSLRSYKQLVRKHLRLWTACFDLSRSRSSRNDDSREYRDNNKNTKPL